MPECVLGGLEIIQAQLGAHFLGGLQIVRIDGYSNGIGNPVVLREIPGYRRGAGHSGSAQCFSERVASGIEPRAIGPDDGFCKFKQRRTARYAGIDFGPNQRLKVDVQLVFTSTLTEELGVIESSVEAVVDCGHPPRDDLGLWPRQPFVVLILVVEQLIQPSVVRDFELHMGAQLVRHETHRTNNVRHRMTLI